MKIIDLKFNFYLYVKGKGSKTFKLNIKTERRVAPH